MKEKVVFALLMGVITTGIISTILITINLGWPHQHIAAWLRSWTIAYLLVIPAILLISPRVEKFVHLLLTKK